MKLKIKKLHPDAGMPSRAYPGDAGLDLTAHSTSYDYTVEREPHITYQRPCKVTAHFEIAVEIPEGYVGKIHARSSIHKTCCRLTNGVGVIDSGYRGGLQAVFDVLPEPCDLPMPDWEKPCAQLIIEPCELPEVVEVDALSPSERGTGGFGSSDERRKK